MAVTPGFPIIQADMGPVATLANSKTSLQNLAGGNYPYSFPDWTPPGVGVNPKWLTGLNNLRQDLARVLGEFSIPDWIYDSISGGPATAYKVAGWPLSGPNTNGASVNNQYLRFWYEDNGQPQTVTAISSGPVESLGTFSTQAVSAGSQGQAPPAPGSPNTARIISQKYDVIIGGSQIVTVSGDFVINFTQFQGGTMASGVWTPDSSTPPVPTWTGSFLPGCSIEMLSQSAWNSAQWGNQCHLRLRINGPVGPGRYTITVNFPAVNDTLTADGYVINSWVQIQPPGDQFLTCFGYNTLPDAPPFGNPPIGVQLSSITIGPGTPALGIDRIANVLSIDLSSLYPPGGQPFSLIDVRAIETDTNGNWFDPPYPQPTFDGEEYAETTTNITATCKGFWTGMSPPVGNINCMRCEFAPWNISIPGDGISGNPMLNGGVAGANTYDEGSTVEAQIEPPAWQSLTNFTPQFTILDSNGNLQQCTTSGKSGSTQPVWKTTIGATTTDGAVIWTCRKLLSGSVSPATHFPILNPLGQVGVKPAMWPYCWQNETNGHLVPPIPPPSPFGGIDPTIWGYGVQWNYIIPGQTYNPVGWYVTNQDGQNNILNGANVTRGSGFGLWIYSLSLNRVSQKIGGVPITNLGDSIPVTVGYYKADGSFSALGTFQTGKTYQVLWPVFTSEPLVYQCAERIDVQAMAIANVSAQSDPLALPGISEGIPMAAAYVQDVIALLDLIS